MESKEEITIYYPTHVRNSFFYFAYLLISNFLFFALVFLNEKLTLNKGEEILLIAIGAVIISIDK
jgi:uncharacterized membrane protein